MEVLRTLSHLSLTLFALAFALSGCDVSTTTTEVIQLETDTYVSTSSSDNHSELTYTQVSKSGANEDRILIKLPTGHNDKDDHIEDCLNSTTCSAFFLPIAILVKLLTTCSSASLTADNLNSAILKMNTVDSSDVAAGSLEMILLAKGWWHTANWTQAHPFSSQGKWTTPGGDLDTSVTFATNCNGGATCASGEVNFDMTDYFKSLIASPNTTHYGLVIRALSDLATTQIQSVQSSSLLTPRIVANFTTSPCLSGSSVSTKRVYYLGKE